MENIYLCFAVVILACNSIKTGLGQPAYDYNCTGTFNQSTGVIRVLHSANSNCQWRFTTHEGSYFGITFNGFDRNPSTTCNTSYVEVQYGSRLVIHCGTNRTPYTVFTGSSVQIRSRVGIGFAASISTVSHSTSTYSLNTSSVTWNEAYQACEDIGATLAEAFPTLTHGMVTQLQTGKSSNRSGQIYKYWVGMSVTQWVSLRGCVQRKTIRQQGLRQINMKNNDKTTCAVRCSGYKGFLLSGKLCECYTDADDTKFNFVSSRQCDIRCPGNQHEQCGGTVVYTMYEYFTGEVKDETASKHCVVKVHDDVIAEHCGALHGFTCTLLNGTNVTFSHTLTGQYRTSSKQQREAIEFCTQLKNAIHMTQYPERPDPYFGESYWTTVSRGIVWNPTQAGTKAEGLSFVAWLDTENNMAYTGIGHNQEMHGFICQHENTTCPGDVTGVEGNITSINYPHPYANYRTCEWHLIVNDKLVIQIDIWHFDLEDSVDCSYDYLQISEKDIKPIALCGKYNQKQILTHGNDVTITMKTDDSLTFSGFALTWTAVEPVVDDTGSSISIYTVKGAAIAGITFGVTMLIIVVVVIAGCIYIRRRQMQPTGNTSYKSSSHNGLYSASSFASLGTQGTASRTGSYMNLTTRPQNVTGDTESNAYEPLSASTSFHAPKESSNSLTVPGSRVQCQSEYMPNTSVDFHLEHTPTHDDHLLTTVNESFTDMKTIEDIGKDSINVVNSDDDTNQPEQHDGYEYIDADVADIDKTGDRTTGTNVTISSQRDKGYLNADLPSDLRQGDEEDRGFDKDIEYAEVDHGDSTDHQHTDDAVVYTAIA